MILSTQITIFIYLILQFNMERVYVAIIKGPTEYLPEGIKFEKFEITQEEIDDFLEDGEEGENEEDAIQYYKEEYDAEWGQHWCSVTFLSESEFNSLYNSVHEFFIDNGDPSIS
jgi:hypothetical protein